MNNPKVEKRIEEKKCPYCGKKFIEAYDEIAEKKTGYIYRPTCKCYPKNVQISIG